MTLSAASIGSDALWPRDDEHRLRLYLLRGGELDCVAAAPDGAGIGVAIETLAAEQGPLPAVGVLDVRPGEETGRWLVNPFSR